MEANPRGVAIVADEMNGFLENMNRYNTGSGRRVYHRHDADGDHA